MKVPTAIKFHFVVLFGFVFLMPNSAFSQKTKVYTKPTLIWTAWTNSGFYDTEIGHFKNTFDACEFARPHWTDSNGFRFFYKTKEAYFQQGSSYSVWYCLYHHSLYGSESIQWIDWPIVGGWLCYRGSYYDPASKMCVREIERLTDDGTCHGNPVKSFSGAKVERETDLEWRIADTVVQVRRIYSSWSPTQSGSAFGPGWHLERFGARLEIEGDAQQPVGVRALRSPTEEIKFTPVDGAWQASYSTRYALFADVGGWRLVDQVSGDIEFYEPSGRLVRWLVGGTKSLTLSYRTDVQSNLKEVSDEFGRKLTFQYDGSGKVAKIVAPGLQTVEYSYDNQSGGQLVSVKFSDGSTRRYVYRTGEQTLGVTPGYQDWSGGGRVLLRAYCGHTQYFRFSLV